MSGTCPNCGTAAARHGTKTRQVIEVGPEGETANSEIRLQRWRCARCATYFTDLPKGLRPRSRASVATRNAVAHACFSAGYSAAAELFGIDEKTARSLWLEWSEARERDLPQRPPEFMGLHMVQIAGSEATVITDAVAETVVDVLRDTSARGVLNWLGKMAEADRVGAAAIALHPPYRDAMRAHAQRVRLVVCRSHAAGWGRRTFLAALRGLRRHMGRQPGGNAREEPRMFLRPLISLSASEREVMSGWDAPVLMLHTAKERYMSALETGGEVDALSMLAEAKALCMRIPAASQPLALMANWGQEIATGVGMRGLDGYAEDLGQLGQVWERRRPRLPFDLSRGLVVLSDAAAFSTEDASGTPNSVGVPISEAARALSAQTGAGRLAFAPRP